MLFLGSLDHFIIIHKFSIEQNLSNPFSCSFFPEANVYISMIKIISLYMIFLPANNVCVLTAQKLIPTTYIHMSTTPCPREGGGL